MALQDPPGGQNFTAGRDPRRSARCVNSTLPHSSGATPNTLASPDVPQILDVCHSGICLFKFKTTRSIVNSCLALSGYHAHSKY